MLYPIELRGREASILTVLRFLASDTSVMSQLFIVHPTHPQPRLMKQAAQLLQAGGILAVPTDSSYALVAGLDDRRAAEALRKLRGLDDRHHLTCSAVIWLRSVSLLASITHSFACSN